MPEAFRDSSAIDLQDGGSVTNQSAASISAFGDGIFGAVGPVTVVNAGSISGTTFAVKLAAGFTNRLVVDPGAGFSGSVNGGNTIGAAAVSTLELASGTSAGTLISFGSKYIDFAQVTIDSGANWTLASSDSFASGVTLTDSGTSDQRRQHRQRDHAGGGRGADQRLGRHDHQRCRRCGRGRGRRGYGGQRRQHRRYRNAKHRCRAPRGRRSHQRYNWFHHKWDALWGRYRGRCRTGTEQRDHQQRRRLRAGRRCAIARWRDRRQWRDRQHQRADYRRRGRGHLYQWRH